MEIPGDVTLFLRMICSIKKIVQFYDVILVYYHKEIRIHCI